MAEEEKEKDALEIKATPQHFSFSISCTPIPNALNPLECSCLENPHGQRSLVGYSPWDRKESEMTERLSTAQVIIIIFLVIC